MKLPTVAPDGILAAMLLAFVATAGIVYVNIMQALVAGLADGLHISGAQAGIIGAANTYGATLGAFAGVLLVPRLEWKRTALIALVLLTAIDLTSAKIPSATALIAVRFVHGLVGGLLVSTGYSVIGRMKNPDRGFGICFMVQYALSGVGNTWLPNLVDRFGVEVLFGAMAAFSVVTLAMLPLLGRYPPPRSATRGARVQGSARLRLVLPALAAVFLFQAANMAVGAYTIGLGRAAGLSLSFASGAVGAASWVGMAGAALVAVVSTRFGRALPVVIAFCATLAGTWLFHRSGDPGLFVAANFVSAGVWAFVLSYLFGICGRVDESGRTVVLAGLCAKLGLATGILLGGRLLGEPETYAPLIDASIAGLLLAAACAIPLALLLDRRNAVLATDG